MATFGISPSCSAKRKLKESTTNEKQKHTAVQTLQIQKHILQNNQFHVDSINRSHWLKVYPKGGFVIDGNGFIGSADSLIWYGNSQQINKYQQREIQHREQLRGDVVDKTEIETVKMQKSQLVKTGTSFWAIMAVVATVCLLVFRYRRMNKS